MKIYVNKYDLQDFYGKYGYDYNNAEEKGEDPYITDEEGNKIATAPHGDKDYFEGSDEKTMDKLADELKSQGVLVDYDTDTDTDDDSIPADDDDSIPADDDDTELLVGNHDAVE